MKKTVSSKLIYALMTVSVLAASCDKNLEVEPKDSLSTEAALGSIGGINAAVNGMYASLRSSNYYGRTLLIFGDLSSNDVYLSKVNSNRYLSTYQRNYSASDADALALWTQAYVAIGRANNIINAVDKVSAPQADKDLAKGQALFIRALAYFDLVRVYAKPWNQGNGAQLGVPVVLTSNVNDAPARNTVAEVYTQIIADLTSAKTLLGATTISDKFTASKFAASALLSRVYLYKGDNANTITEATTVIGAGYTLQPVSPAFFATSGSPEEIFTVKFLLPESLGSDNLGNFYLKPGYGDARVSPELVSAFDANDQRRITYISAFSSSPSEYQNNKFTGEDGVQGMYSPKVLRLAEIILNRAEAYAKSNNAALALADVNTIRTSRGLTALSGLSGQPLVDAILEERRKELMFEGHRFFDMIRNGKDIVRAYCNQTTQVSTTNCTLAATDNKVIMPIPQAERDANPNITQNTGY